MSNKLSDLNNHLFSQLDRLSVKDLTIEQIEQEVKRTDAIVDISDKIINSAELSLKVAKLVAEHGTQVGEMLPMIEHKEAKKPDYSPKGT